MLPLLIYPRRVEWADKQVTVASVATRSYDSYRYFHIVSGNAERRKLKLKTIESASKIEY